MNLHTPDDLGRKLWTLYRNQPTLVKVIGLAVEVHVEEDDTRYVTDASNLHISFAELVESIKEPCPF
jgi:hypothetical protein